MKLVVKVCSGAGGCDGRQQAIGGQGGLGEQSKRGRVQQGALAPGGERPLSPSGRRQPLRRAGCHSPPKPSSLFQVPLLEASGSTPMWAHMAWNCALRQ